MNTRSLGAGIGAALLCVLLSSPASAQPAVPFVGLGDSIGEGVQSGDANEATQGFSFINLIGWHMGTDLSLPFIRTGWFGAVGSTDGRSRVNAATRSRNLAVSGADVASILRDAATALTTAEIDTETELVLFPETGSQIEIAERLNPAVVACWIGNNDALGAALAYDQLNATQLTPISEFTADFTELVQRHTCDREDQQQAGRHRESHVQGPADGCAQVSTAAFDAEEVREVGGQHREPARVDDDEHALGEVERERGVDHVWMPRSSPSAVRSSSAVSVSA